MAGIARRNLLLAGGVALTAGSSELAFDSFVREKSRKPGVARSIAETFARPGVDMRPSVEWFVPTGPTTEAGLARQVDDLADAGIGAGEVLPWALHDGNPTVDGWGTPAWNARMEAAAAAAERRGIQLSLTLAPEVPTGAPSITPDSPGASKELVYGHVTVPGGTTYNGAVPPPRVFDISDPFGRPDRKPGKEKLLAATVAKVAGSSGKTVLLDPSSLADITASVHGGRIAWAAPSDGRWLLFGFWLRGTGQITDDTADPIYAVDFYSKSGSEAVTRHWDKKLLTPRLRKLLRRCGASVREDSLELQFVLPWTDVLLTEFEARRDYNPAPYLPLLVIERLHVYAGTEYVVGPDSPADFDLADGMGPRVRNDYYRTLTELYQENHLDELSSWAKRNGLGYSAAIGPRSVLDRSYLASTLEEVENDRVFFTDGDLDDYRAIAGGVHLGGTKVYSSELAPVTGELFQDAYGVTWQRMLDIIHQAYAAGVNHARLHYFPYSDLPGARWPGWAAFSPLELGPGVSLPGFAEPWGPRQPTWKHLPDITGYLARQQTVLRAGKPRVDVVVYRHSFWERGDIPEAFWSDPGLRRTGYTYDFAGPDLLRLPSARVEDGRLAPDGPGYRALVLNRQSTLPLEAARRILQLAREGLPVIVVGEPPRQSPYYSRATEMDASVRRTMRALLNLAIVRRVASEAEVPAALRDLRVLPTALFDEPSELLSVHREDAGVRYHWFFNPGNDPVDLGVSLGESGEVYELDAWTGRILRRGGVRVSGDRLPVRIKLAPKQATILAITERDLPASAIPSNQVTKVEALTSWRLSVEDWRPGRTPKETSKVVVHKNLERLEPWRQIPGLEDSSGIGTYTTGVRSSSDSALLDLGRVAGTCRVKVNGRRLPPIDQTRPVADLRGRLRAGVNTIEVEVATTLRNRLRIVEPSQTETEPQVYGLLGPVLLLHTAP